MKRTGIKSKRTKPRTTKTVRCKRQRCSRSVVVAGLCKTHVIDRLDSITRKKAYLDIPACAKCGVTRNLQWSHHLSRKFMFIRWDPRNYTCHCRECHAWFTYNPAAHVEWIKQHVGEKTWLYLFSQAYGKPNDMHGTPQFKTADLIEAWERLS